MTKFQIDDIVTRPNAIGEIMHYLIVNIKSIYYDGSMPDYVFYCLKRCKNFEIGTRTVDKDPVYKKVA